MARIINFYDNASSSTTPTIGNISASDLNTYIDDAGYEAGNDGSPVLGNIYINSTDGSVRYYNGTNWIEIATVTETDAIRTTQGTSAGDTDMGSYTGSIIASGESVKENIQSLETAIEGLAAGLSFQGNWDADSNSPSLASGVGSAGHYFNVSVAGATNLDGITDWEVGDWAIFTETGVWQKIDNTSTVTSVNSQTGAVDLGIDDLNDVDTTTSSPSIGDSLEWDGSNWVAVTPAAAGNPVATVIISASNIAPTGYLYCDGNPVSRVTYSNLYALLGDAYGEGDGSTTFNLPDMRGKFARGIDDGAGNDPNAGTRVATATGGNTGDNIGSEQADATDVNGLGTNTTGSSHGHTITATSAGEAGSGKGTAGGEANQGTIPVASGGSHTHGVTSSDDETRPLNLSFKYYIKY